MATAGPSTCIISTGRHGALSKVLEAAGLPGRVAEQTLGLWPEVGGGDWAHCDLRCQLVRISYKWLLLRAI